MKRYLLLFLLFWNINICVAQNDRKSMHGMDHRITDSTASSEEDMDDMDMSDQTMKMSIGEMHMQAMSSALSLNLPMSRDGSGTSWVPDATPVYAKMLHKGKWMFMFHGDIFIRYDRQDLFNAGVRGGDKWDAPDMLMAMGQRQVGRNGLFHINAMFSTDALVAGGNGYPLLYQTGESWQGKPLVDRQHPHDLFSELSASYAYAFSKKSDLSVYVGYPGEPALGPVTFMHRPSGEFMPDAPISHHWADATHITFGVATLGLRYGKFKIEGSSFTGREPDENRYDLDKPLFDSWSGRLSFNPSAYWALQVSHGFIKSPESLHPDEDVNRTTASASYEYSFINNTYVAATALWGQNAIAGQAASNAVLLEATLKLHRIALYTRYEWVQKTSEELNLETYFPGSDIFAINAITLGGGYDLFTIDFITVAGGVQGSLYTADSQLAPLYGKDPLAAEVYLHIYPKKL